MVSMAVRTMPERILMFRLGLLVALIFLGQPGGFAADTQAPESKLYVLHSGTGEMSVIDRASHRVIKTLKVGGHPHGIAAPAAQSVLYVSSEDDSSITVIDTGRDEVVKTYIGFGTEPNEIDITADGRYLYVPVRGDGVFEVFDIEAERIIKRIPTDGIPHNVVVSPDSRYMYLAPMEMPDHRRAELTARGFPTSLNRKIYIADTRTHEVVGTIPVENAPRPLVVSQDGRYLYVNTNNLLGFLVLDVAQRRIVALAEYQLTAEEQGLPSRSHGIGVTPDQREVWSTDVNRGLVFVFDVSGPVPKQVARLETGRTPLWLTLSPDGATVYVANTADDTVSVIDARARAELTRIQLPPGSAPTRMLALDTGVP